MVNQVSNGRSRSKEYSPNSVSDGYETDSQRPLSKSNAMSQELLQTCFLWYRKLRQWFMNGRAPPGHPYVPTNMEHIANITTHALWIMPSLVGMLAMINMAVTHPQYLSAIIYGSALLALFTTSTVFHLLSYSGKFRTLKNFFHIGDRAVIYIFIAASYTPWLLLKDFDHNWSTYCLWVVWIAAIFGIAYQYTFHEQYKWLETLFYLIIGVCPSIVVLAMKDISGLNEMVMGGLVYVCGVVFFKMDGIIPFAHAIWHCFVFVGATFHYCAVCKHLLGFKIDIASS